MITIYTHTWYIPSNEKGWICVVRTSSVDKIFALEDIRAPSQYKSCKF